MINKTMKYIAVITGDIIDSRKIEKKKFDELIYGIDRIFHDIEKNLDIDIKWDIWRGDSFQARIGNPENAMLVAILIRAGLKSNKYNEDADLWDARISIGIGEENSNNNQVSRSYGSAYISSGESLSEISSKCRLTVNIPNAFINEVLDVSSFLVDGYISDWTKKQAEAMYYYLLYDKRQEIIADKLNISQVAVSKRISKFNRRIDKFLELYKSLITKEYGI